MRHARAMKWHDTETEPAPPRPERLPPRTLITVVSELVVVVIFMEIRLASVMIQKNSIFCLNLIGRHADNPVDLHPGSGVDLVI